MVFKDIKKLLAVYACVGLSFLGGCKSTIPFEEHNLFDQRTGIYSEVVFTEGKAIGIDKISFCSGNHHITINKGYDGVFSGEYTLSVDRYFNWSRIVDDTNLCVNNDHHFASVEGLLDLVQEYKKISEEDCCLSDKLKVSPRQAEGGLALIYNPKPKTECHRDCSKVDPIYIQFNEFLEEHFDHSKY